MFVITALLIKCKKNIPPRKPKKRNNTSHNEQDKEPQTQHKKKPPFFRILVSRKTMDNNYKRFVLCFLVFFYGMSIIKKREYKTYHVVNMLKFGEFIITHKKW